ncbi:hypothetical protein I5G58_gp024 [Mycobacterium phage BirdsNest]|uniref:Uncharacterized protein n=1 Tax=Mycobacterium phage BirdsNest TaxID=2686231 RepID=A0A6B9L6X1_9CAUD|nr:hypothetical protein I5G58_gp024 [Mycobacterium phage BirdsNest]QHB37326.1 hypothetical protein PBI_BIRDSNEST_24 [Mycobacterium phage BirdsNest]
MTDYDTRELTAEETDAFLRGLHLALGKQGLVDAALRVIAEQGLGIFKATERPDVDAAEAILAEGTPTADGGLVLEPSPYFMSDEAVSRMHDRQAAALMPVAANDRGAVVRHAHFLMNVTGGNLSGNIHTAIGHLKAAGSAEALMEQDRADNAALMRASGR